MQGKLMKRMIVLIAVIVVLAGCGNSKKTEVDYSPTYVAQTIDAWERSTAQPQTEITPNPAPTNTPTPTKEMSVLDKIADSLELGYCPETILKPKI
jgi:PBP1b-binding outer membrane lipoprotein LpoB